MRCRCCSEILLPKLAREEGFQGDLVERARACATGRMGEAMRTRKYVKSAGGLDARRSTENAVGTEHNESSSAARGRDALIARLTELHGQAGEIARRMMDDARILADVQRETSTVLRRLWELQTQPPRPAPLESPSMSNTEPRFLRFPDVAKRVGLSRSSVWRLERAGQFPRHRRLSSNTVGWWEPEIDAWLRNRPDSIR